MKEYAQHAALRTLIIVKLQLDSQLNMHFKLIQLLQELSWSYAL